MSPGNDGQLADLWAVGGEHFIRINKSKGYYAFCPGCGWKLTGKFSTCPRCGEDLRTEMCPYCKGSIPYGVEHCPRCTVDLSDPVDLK